MAACSWGRSFFLPRESGHELSVAAQEILHRGLLGFEPEAGLALADGTDAEVGDKLGHWYKTTPFFQLVTKVKRTFNK